MVQQGVEPEQLALLVDALCSDPVRSVDQEPAQQQLLAVIFNTITLAGRMKSGCSQDSLHRLSIMWCGHRAAFLFLCSSYCGVLLN